MRDVLTYMYVYLQALLCSSSGIARSPQQQLLCPRLDGREVHHTDNGGEGGREGRRRVEGAQQHLEPGVGLDLAATELDRMGLWTRRKTFLERVRMYEQM